MGITGESRDDGKNNKNINNNFIANNNDEVDPRLDYKGYILTSCSALACHSNTYQQTVANSTTDAQKRSLGSLENAPKTVIPSRANSGIVLITTKLNQSDESKLIHYNTNSSNALSKTNLELFNTVQKATEGPISSALQQQSNVGSNEQQQQPKTATILVSKSKTKTGLPLLLKKSK